MSATEEYRAAKNGFVEAAISLTSDWQAAERRLDDAVRALMVEAMCAEFKRRPKKPLDANAFFERQRIAAELLSKE